jgi:hypothetical protein
MKKTLLLCFIHGFQVRYATRISISKLPRLTVTDLPGG